MVALSAEKGYEATKIGDLAKVAGVSRAAFYDHFKDKKECLLATVEALVEPTIALIERSEDAGTGEARVRQAVEAFFGLIAAQPAASKMCFIEVYAAGPEGVAEIERVLDVFEQFGVGQFNQIPGRKGMPSQMVRAILGGLQKVVHKRLYSDEAGQLPRLAEDIATWGLSYPPPPGPLEAPRRRGRKARPFAERQAIAHPPERVLRALAAIVSEKGYRAATVAEVVERAGTSQRVFYGHFENKEEAFLAALDSGSAQMLGLVLPAFRRANSWQESVRAAYEAMFSFGIEEPEYTQLGAVEMYTVGRRALQTRDTVMEGLEALLVPGYELAPDTPPIAAEAIGGAIYALIHDQVKRNGPESLPDLAPTATYMTLAPFIGAEEAYERAIEESDKW
jgi:AcrR family transcriptional regulator